VTSWRFSGLAPNAMRVRAFFSLSLDEKNWRDKRLGPLSGTQLTNATELWLAQRKKRRIASDRMTGPPMPPFFDAREIQLSARLNRTDRLTS
jgi:hypothetical protein